MDPACLMHFAAQQKKSLYIECGSPDWLPGFRNEGRGGGAGGCVGIGKRGVIKGVRDF